MAENINNTVENVEQNENVQEQPQAAEAAKHAAPEEVAKEGLFTRIGKAADGLVERGRNGWKRKGKKIAKGIGTGLGVAAAVVGVGVVMDTIEKAKALESGASADGDPIDVDPVEAESLGDAPFEAAAEEAVS